MNFQVSPGSYTGRTFLYVLQEVFSDVRPPKMVDTANISSCGGGQSVERPKLFAASRRVPLVFRLEKQFKSQPIRGWRI